MPEQTDKRSLPPYVPYKTFVKFINGLREKRLPQHITRDVYPGSNSGKASMSAAFKVMKLINGDDTPTQKLQQIVESEDNYTDVLNVILGETYDFLADPELDLATTTTDKLEQRFRTMGASGSTVSKCMQFFLLAAKDAGIQISSYVKAPAPKRNPLSKHAKRELDPPSSSTKMTKIIVPLHGMEDWTIQFPEQMSDTQWDQGLKMTQLILDNYRSGMVAIQDESDDEEDESVI